MFGIALFWGDCRVKNNKKTKLTFFAAITAVAVAAGILTHTAGRTMPMSARIYEGTTIVIDPGHGGPDGGAVGVDGIVEKHINLNISLTLRDMLTVLGYDVIMTREDDRSIHSEGVEGLRKQKNSDLNNRLDFTKRYPDSIFISVHQNQFAASGSYGAQIFYSPNNPESERFAELTQRRFATMLQPDNKRMHKIIGSNIYVLYKAENPAILAECGFLSNPAEAHKLNDPDYQRQVAFVLAGAAEEYFVTRPQDPPAEALEK